MVKSINSSDGKVYNQTGHTFIPAPPTPDCKSCHASVTETHSMWGAGENECLTCHSPVAMTQLHLLDNTSVAISDSSVLCQQCHNEKYYEWKMGIHGDPHGEKKCVDCHEAMHWYVMLNATLPPIKVSSAQPVINPSDISVNVGDLSVSRIEFGYVIIGVFVVLVVLGFVYVITKL